MHMDTFAPGILTRDEMESRRLLAAQDLQTGVSQSHVARKYGVSRTTASRWGRTLNGKGVEALHKRRAPGRPCRLGRDQLAATAELFHAGPLAMGFDAPRWTTALFAEAVYRRFGIHYDPDHIGRILHKLGLQTRARRARVQEQPMPALTQLAS